MSTDRKGLVRLCGVPLPDDRAGRFGFAVQGLPARTGKGGFYTIHYQLLEAMSKTANVPESGQRLQHKPPRGGADGGA